MTFLCSMNVLRAAFSSVLAILVLFSSMGFYVDHMVCGMSGEHKLAINGSVGTCSDSCMPSGDNTVSRTCCDRDSDYFQEDLPATPSESHGKQQFSSSGYVPLTGVFSTANCAGQCCFRLIDEPDILPSVERHVLLETYLI